MSYDRFRLQALLAAVLATIAFLLLSSMAIIWANGLRFNPITRKFEQTAVLAIDQKLENIRVKVNSVLVATETPWQGRSLAAGPYQVILEKTGFYPFEQTFNLTPGEVGLVTNIIFIAETPKVTSLEAGVELPEQTVFDFQLSIVDGELLDRGRLVTRFSQLPIQVHRFNANYLYQQNNELRLFLPISHQDFLLTTLPHSELVPLQVLPGAWQVIFKTGATASLLELTVPSAVSPRSRL